MAEAPPQLRRSSWKVGNMILTSLVLIKFYKLFFFIFFNNIPFKTLNCGKYLKHNGYSKG